MAVGRDGTPSSLASRWQRWCCWGVLGTSVPGAVFREPMIFLGTLNQANTRNWATAVVRHADFYKLLNLSLLFCNSLLLVIFCALLRL